LWLPPGGHIDPDEDPVQAVVREVLEETGIVAEVVPHVAPLPFTNVAQIATPLVIICADVDEGPHQHIDMSYALRPVAGAARQEPDGDHGFIWVTEDQLRRDLPLPVASCGVDIKVAEDVRMLGLKAIELVRNAELLALIWDWDPVGVAGAEFVFVADEYDGLVRFVLNNLRAGLDADALSAALIAHLKTDWGLPEQRGTGELASRAVAWFEGHGRPGAYTRR
jgi:8-oxo-dGTP pyrophosphatase MutT (NUDIX family)